MLALHKHLVAVKVEQAYNLMQGQIDATDAESDRLVDELYGLTDDEIRIVEGAVAGTVAEDDATLPQILAALNTELGTTWQAADVPALPGAVAEGANSRPALTAGGGH